MADKPKHSCFAISCLIGPWQFLCFLFSWSILLSVNVSAQVPECPDPLPADGRICEDEESDSNEDIVIDGSGQTIRTSGNHGHGILGLHQGRGEINIDISGGSITTTGENQSSGIYGFHGGAGDVSIDVSGGSITTEGNQNAQGIWGWHRGTGNIDIDFSDGSITTKGERSYGIYGNHQGEGDKDTGDVNIDFSEGSVDTEGDFSHGIAVQQRVVGNVSINFSDGSITTNGATAYGMDVSHLGTGDINIVFSDGSITTNGATAYGMDVKHRGTGDVNINFTDATINTYGEESQGIFSDHTDSGELIIRFFGGRIVTNGTFANGIYGYHRGTGTLKLVIEDTDIETTSTGDNIYLGQSFGTISHGIYARRTSSSNGHVSVTFSGGTIKTSGTNSHGIYGRNQVGTGGTGDISIDFSDGSITTSGSGSHGIHVLHAGNGNALITTGEGTGIIAAGNNASGINTSGPTNVIRIFGRAMGGTGTGAGLNISGPGKVTIGPNGFVGSGNGVAIRTDNTLHVDLLSTNGRPWELLGGRFDVASKSDTTLSVHSVILLNDNEFRDVWAPSGLHLVKLNPEFPHGTASFDFSTEEAWLRHYHPRTGVYEALPGPFDGCTWFHAGFHPVGGWPSISVADVENTHQTGLIRAWITPTISVHSRFTSKHPFPTG